MDQNVWDVIVVGGGSGGLSAALTLGRARRRVLVIDAGSPRNRFAEHTQGLLGADGIDPVALLRAGRDEVRRYGVELAPGSVESVVETAEPDRGVLRLTRADGTVDHCRALIAATGMTDELPDLPGLAPRWGKTVLHCPYCHGWEVRDQRLGVLATSLLSLHQVQLVRQWSNQVVFFTAGAGDLDDPTRRRLTSRGIALVDSSVTQVLGDTPHLSGVRTADGAVVELDALFTGGIARPHDGYLDRLALNRVDTPMGEFLAVDATGRTSHDRVWAAGNVTDPAANVALSISGGVRAAAAVNMVLVNEEFDTAALQAAAVTAGTRA